MSFNNGLQNDVHLKDANGVNATVVNLTVDSTVVSATAAVLYGVCVNTVLSAHTCAIQDNSVTKVTLPASLAVGGYDIGCGNVGVKFSSNLTITPNALATGEIVVFWKPAYA